MKARQSPPSSTYACAVVLRMGKPPVASQFGGGQFSYQELCKMGAHERELSAAASYPSCIICVDTFPAVWCACTSVKGKVPPSCHIMVPVQLCRHEARLGSSN